MAKAKNNAKAEAATATRKETLRADLEVLVNKYNESAEFRDRKSTRLNSSHNVASRMPASA